MKDRENLEKLQLKKLLVFVILHVKKNFVTSDNFQAQARKIFCC